MKIIRTIAAITSMFLISGANAGLIDRGNGMIYDDVQDLTWLADANQAKTSGYDDDGYMSWDEANAWANQLEFGGYTDWRLYEAAEPSNSCKNGIGVDYACIENELAHLFMIDLGFSEITHPVTQYYPNENYTLFQNINLNSAYWSSTDMSTYNPFGFYTIGLGSGGVEQNAIDKFVTWGSWAVRDGDVASIPEPSTLAILSLAMLGLASNRFKKS